MKDLSLTFKIFIGFFIAIAISMPVASQGSDNGIETEISYEYSSFIISSGNQRDLFVKARNNADSDKTLRTYLSGVNSTFIEFSDNKTGQYTLSPSSEREFVVRVEPENSGNYRLNVTTEDVGLGINNSDTIPVYSKDYASGSSPSEVSGIGFVHILGLLFSSTILYFVSL